MLHVRVVSPPASTDDLLDRLSVDPGVRNLVVVRGAARRPDGDAVQFDLLTRFANPVLEEVRARMRDRGSVVIENVEAAASGPEDQEGAGGRERIREPSDPQAASRLQHGEVPPVWEMVESKIRAGGEYPPSFYALLVIAGLIGAVGILINSQILVVAAMVVGPEYGAIMATALGIDKRDRRAVRHGLAALAAGFALAVLATLVFGLLIRWSGQTPRPYEVGVQARLRPHQLTERVLGHRGGAGRHCRRRLADRVPGERAHRRVHLGYHDSRRLRHGPVRRVRQLARGARVDVSAAA